MLETNNPGNLRVTNQPWVGKTTPEGAEFETFDTAEHGLRAMAIILKNDIKNGVNTIEKIVEKWAPTNENDTDAYIDAVSDFTGYDSYTILTANADTLAELVEAIVRQENGSQPYSIDLIGKAVQDAFI
jgi:hypothetical protein